jgi:hypothetical protein
MVWRENWSAASIPKRVAVQMTGHETSSAFERHIIVFRG